MGPQNLIFTFSHPSHKTHVVETKWRTILAQNPKQTKNSLFTTSDSSRVFSVWVKKVEILKTKTLTKQVCLEDIWTIWPSVKWSLSSMSWSQSMCFTGVSPECRFVNFPYRVMTHLGPLCTSSTENKKIKNTKHK